MNRRIRPIFLSFLLVLALATTSYSQVIKATISAGFGGSISFGNVVVGKTIDRTFTIRNDSTSTADLAVTIAGPTSTAYSIVGGVSFAVPAGITKTVTVHFAPGTVGNFNDSLFVQHNATSSSQRSPYRIRITATSVKPDSNPKIQLSTTFVQCGTVSIKKTISKTFTITNVSDSLHTLTGNVGDPLQSIYTVSPGGGAFSLDSGKSLTVTVNFTPDSAKQYFDSLFVTSNSDSATKRIRVILIGTGTKIDTFPQITIGGQGILNFRTDTVGKTKTLSFTMRNSSDSLRLLTGNVSTPNAPYSIVSGGGNFSLDSGSTKTVTVMFAPTVAGLFRDTIVISTNSDGANKLIKYPLTGTGVIVAGPIISILPNKLSFGTFPLGGGPLTLSVVIKNIADSSSDTLKGTVSMTTLPFTVMTGGGDFILSKSESKNITVQFLSIVTGVFKDSLVITSNSNDNAKRFVIPITATLTALGVQEGKNAVSYISAMPNPFTKRTSIGFSLLNPMPVQLRVYDILGKQIVSTSEKVYPAGSSQIEWNASGLENGIYLCVLQIGKETRSVRVVLSK